MLALDRRDRGDFLRSFYRRFDGAPIAQLRADAWELFHRQLLTKSFPEGFARVRAHRALGQDLGGKLVRLDRSEYGPATLTVDSRQF